MAATYPTDLFPTIKRSAEISPSRLLQAQCGHLVRISGRPDATRETPRMCPTCEDWMFRKMKMKGVKR